MSDTQKHYRKAIVNQTDSHLHVTIHLREGYNDVSKTYPVPLGGGVPANNKRVFDLLNEANRGDQFTGMPFLNRLQIHSDDRRVAALDLTIKVKSSTDDDTLNTFDTLTITNSGGKLHVKGSNTGVGIQ